MDIQLNSKLNMVDIIIDVIKEQTWHVVEGQKIFIDVMCRELNIYFGKSIVYMVNTNMSLNRQPTTKFDSYLIN